MDQVGAWCILVSQWIKMNEWLKKKKIQFEKFNKWYFIKCLGFSSVRNIISSLCHLVSLWSDMLTAFVVNGQKATLTSMPQLWRETTPSLQFSTLACFEFSSCHNPVKLASALCQTLVVNSVLPQLRYQHADSKKILQSPGLHPPERGMSPFLLQIPKCNKTACSSARIPAWGRSSQPLQPLLQILCIQLGTYYIKIFVVV